MSFPLVTSCISLMGMAIYWMIDFQESSGCGFTCLFWMHISSPSFPMQDCAPCMLERLWDVFLAVSLVFFSVGIVNRDFKAFAMLPVLSSVAIEKLDAHILVWHICFPAVAIFIGTLFLAKGSLNAASHVHKNLLTHVMQNPVSFFESTPTGRIVNRFSKDVDAIDNTLPATIRTWLWCLYAVGL